MEEWKPIPGAPTYDVSTLGRVRKDFGNWKTGTRLIKSRFSSGVMSVSLSIGGKQKSFSLPRLVALAFLGECPWPNAVVRAIDGNSRNVVLSNLAWALRPSRVWSKLEGRFTEKGDSWRFLED